MILYAKYDMNHDAVVSALFWIKGILNVLSIFVYVTSLNFDIQLIYIHNSRTFLN